MENMNGREIVNSYGIELSDNALRQEIIEKQPAISERIKALMNERSFSQTTLAAAAKTSREMFNGVLRNRRQLSPDLLARIAAALDCSIYYLLGIPKDKTEEAKTKNELLRFYLLSFGIERDASGNYIMHAGSYNRRGIISPEDFKRLALRIDCAAAALIDEAFFEDDYILTSEIE